MTVKLTADEALGGATGPKEVAQKTTKGTVYYIEKPVNGDQLYAEVQTAEKSAVSNLKRNEKEVVVHDIRTAGRPFSLLTNGFELHKLEVPKDLEWDNADQVCHLVHHCCIGFGMRIGLSSHAELSAQGYNWGLTILQGSSCFCTFMHLRSALQNNSAAALMVHPI